MSFVYPKFKQALLSGQVNLLTADVRVIIIDVADYSPLPTSTDEFLTAVPAAARVAVSGPLQAKTVDQPAPGVFDAADISIPCVTGDQAEALLLYLHTGSDATARLVAFIDSGAGLPLTPNGDAVNVVWDGDPNRIFRI